MSNDLVIPSAFDVDTSSVGGVPYVTFFSDKSPRAGDYKLAIPGVREPDPLLIRPAPETPLKLSPLQFFLVNAKQLWLDAEDDGTINRVSFTRIDDKPFQENIEAVLMVINGQKLFPARATFRTTKCNGPKVACKANDLAADKDHQWSSLSAEHAATMKIPAQWARFTTTIGLQQKTAKKSGRKYWLTQGTVKPTTPEQFQLLLKHMQQPEFKALIAAVNAAYIRRIETLNEYVVQVESSEE